MLSLITSEYKMQAEEKGMSGPCFRPLARVESQPGGRNKSTCCQLPAASSPDPILPRILGQIMEIWVTHRVWGGGGGGGGRGTWEESMFHGPWQKDAWMGTQTHLRSKNLVRT